MPYAFLPTADSVTRDVILRGILTSFPPGINVEPGTNWYKLAEAWADADYRVVQQIAEFQREMNPGTSTISKVLPRWEDAVVDKECANIPGLTEQQRQALVVSSIRGSVRGLTVSEIQTDINAQFPGLGAVVTEHFPKRISDPVDGRELRMGDNIGDYTWLQVAIPNYDPASALHQRVNCRLKVTLPIGIVYWTHSA